MCTVSMPGTSIGQKKVSGPLAVELQKAVDQHVGSGSWSQDFCTNNKHS